MSRKWRCRKQQPKASLRSGNRSHQPVNHRVDTGDKRLSRKFDGGIIEDPHAFILIWSDDSDGIHTTWSGPSDYLQRSATQNSRLRIRHSEKVSSSSRLAAFS